MPSVLQAESEARVDPRVADEVRRRILRPVDAVLAVVALLVGAVLVAGGVIPPVLQYAPFALSLILFGLPHGAVDHLVPARLGTVSKRRSVTEIVLLYAVLGSLDLALWCTAPAIAFLAFVALTWFHWGQGDVFTAIACDGFGRARRGGRVALLVLRGGIPMLVPLITQPAAYAGVIATTTSIFAPHTVDLLTPLLSPTARVLAAVVLAGALVVELLLASGVGRRPFLRTTAETALLTVYFATVPPVLAVGLYFCLWHSVQHIVRLQLLDPPSAAALAAGRLLPAMRRFAVAAAPLTSGALLLLGALAVAEPHVAGPGALLGLYLVLISALTVPHAAVVTLMDRRQAVWSRADTAALVTRAPRSGV